MLLVDLGSDLLHWMKAKAQPCMLVLNHHQSTVNSSPNSSNNSSNYDSSERGRKLGPGLGRIGSVFACVRHGLGLLVRRWARVRESGLSSTQSRAQQPSNEPL